MFLNGSKNNICTDFKFYYNLFLKNTQNNIFFVIYCELPHVMSI